MRLFFEGLRDRRSGCFPHKSMGACYTTSGVHHPTALTDFCPGRCDLLTGIGAFLGPAGTGSALATGARLPAAEEQQAGRCSGRVILARHASGPVVCWGRLASLGIFQLQKA